MRILKDFKVPDFKFPKFKMKEISEIDEVKVDYDKIKGTVILRGRIYGDRIQLVGCNFTSSVKKRIQEKVPQNRRKTLHFLEDEEGLFYAEQIGMAQRVAPDAATKRLLFLAVWACQSTACTTNDSNGAERME